MGVSILQEIRLYYESLEQAYHFVFPLIQKTLQNLSRNVDVKLVKMKKKYKYYSRRLAPIFFWKEPDILMTIVKNNEEYPLLLIEFSTAVFTEDHELQRFDGMLAAAKNNCVYVKISPTEKESPYEHGGKVEFDYVKPYRLIYSKYKKPYFHFEWECNEKGVVKTDPEFLSCPEKIDEFEILLQAIVEHIVVDGYSDEWIDKLSASLQKYEYFQEWLSALREKLEFDVSDLNTSRTRWIKKDPFLCTEVLEVKLNRFGHAMDPERGMLAYYGTLVENVVSKMIFSKLTNAWYKDIPKEREIGQIVQGGLKDTYDYLLCFALGSGLYKNKDFMNIIRKYRKCRERNIRIDLTKFVQTHFCELSKPLKTIFSYSRLFVIEDDSGERRVTFVWQPVEESRAYKNYPKVTPITKRKWLDEDDVTYVVVHNILKPNGYKIIAVSYPGAQGDRRILIQAGTGRRQPRKYIDIISFLPEKATNLEENKGIFNATELQKDIEELVLYKTDNSYRQGLKNFLEIYAPEAIGIPVKIGVGFWANKSFNISSIKDLNIDELDYFVYITRDRKQWKIWRTGKDDMFSITSGEVSLPKTYEIVTRQASSMRLSDFGLWSV